MSKIDFSISQVIDIKANLAPRSTIATPNTHWVELVITLEGGETVEISLFSLLQTRDLVREARLVQAINSAWHQEASDAANS